MVESFYYATKPGTFFFVGGGWIKKPAELPFHLIKLSESILLYSNYFGTVKNGDITHFQGGETWSSSHSWGLHKPEQTITMSQAVTQCAGASTSVGGSPAKSWNTRRARQQHNVSQPSFHTHAPAWSAQRAGRSTARRPRTDTLPPGLNRRLFLHAYLQLQHGTSRNLIAVAHDTERYPHPNVNWQSTITRLAKLLRQAMSCRLGQQKSLKMYFSIWKMKLVVVRNVQDIEFAMYDERSSCLFFITWWLYLGNLMKKQVY